MMALVRVDFHESRATAFQMQIGVLITQVMRDVLGVPEAENYVLATPHPLSAICHQPMALDDAQRAQIVFIQITLNQGRSSELKQAFYAQLKQHIHQQLGIPITAVFINLIEVDRANWAFA